ncbi:ATP-binding protein [Neobacillus sp. 114]|uniref:ATP-binding protein n=1 Tax=Neobacillus sp. 114 TaxID=3048535 RepID=UPI0024C45309|nr:ATP-binding protein [Neobacillus sp. 114]
MKPLLNRLIGGKGTQPTQEEQPIPLTIDSIAEHQRASIVGWVANKLGQQLNLEQANKGVFINEVLHKNIEVLDLDMQEDFIFHLANIMISWIEKDEDVYLNLKQMNLGRNNHQALLEVYEIIKSNQNLYFNRKSPDEKEATEEDKIWEVYRDVLHAASQQKFLLAREEEIKPYTEGTIICNEPVVEKSDIPRVRNKAKEDLEKLGIPKSKILSYVLLISEAVTNIIKHAKDGRLLITKTDNSLSIVIEDTGPGFPLKILPYTVLTAGYSTKKSLGQGFTLMLKLASRVLLETSPNGSTIVLIFKENEGEEREQIAKAT